MKPKPGKTPISCVDLFCGAGGLSHGLFLEGLTINAGIDMDPASRYPFMVNNQAAFIQSDIAEVAPEYIARLFTPRTIRVLAGCAPCQPFSVVNRAGDRSKEHKWRLLYDFKWSIVATRPDIIVSENVPTAARYSVFNDFIKDLRSMGYYVWHGVVNCADYGVPQTRKRLILMASLHGAITMWPPTTDAEHWRTVRHAIGHLPPIRAGETHPKDRLHVSSSLSEINLKRIRATKYGGTWHDWPKELYTRQLLENPESSHRGVFGRMVWDKPAPTITTHCHGYGNGRFGHPEQDRAISLREAALLQSFPQDYQFVPPNEKVKITTISRLIGNAVPVLLGRAIARSILRHLGITPTR